MWCLITRGVADRAAADRDLFKRVAEHREIFFRLNWVDYATLRPGFLRLTPPADHRGAWRRDYQEMAEPMFYGERPGFDEILRVVGEFEQRSIEPRRSDGDDGRRLPAGKFGLGEAGIEGEIHAAS